MKLSSLHTILSASYNTIALAKPWIIAPAWPLKPPPLTEHLTSYSFSLFTRSSQLFILNVLPQILFTMENSEIFHCEVDLWFKSPLVQKVEKS